MGQCSTMYQWTEYQWTEKEQTGHKRDVTGERNTVFNQERQPRQPGKSDWNQRDRRAHWVTALYSDDVQTGYFTWCRVPVKWVMHGFVFCLRNSWTCPLSVSSTPSGRGSQCYKEALGCMTADSWWSSPRLLWRPGECYFLSWSVLMLCLCAAIEF